MRTDLRFLLLLISTPFVLSIGKVAANEYESNRHVYDDSTKYIIGDLSEKRLEVSTLAISHFDDILPTDWAYGALKNLVDQHGCISGYNSSKFSGNKSISRFEAAALLNKCLDQVTVYTDEVTKLIEILDDELSTIRTKVNDIDSRATDLEKTLKFSTTTKLSIALFNWYAANNFSGSNTSENYNKDFGGFNNAYGIIPTLTTSFTGKDYLQIIGLTGNCDDFSPAAAQPFLSTYAPQCSAGVLNDSSAGDNQLVLWRMYYSFPLFNDDLTVTIGPRMYAYDFLPISNAVFGPKAGSLIGLKTLPLDIIQNAGVPGVYPYVLGAGFGLSYEKDGWSLATGYLSQSGNESQGDLGLFGESSVKEAVVQVALTKQNAGFQAAWSNTAYPEGGFVFQEGTPLTANPFSFSVPFTVNSFSGGGYFYLAENLSISGGLNKLFYTANSDNSSINLRSGEMASALTGVVTVQLEKALVENLTLGLSYGVPTYLQSNPTSDGVDERPNMILTFANYALSNNIQLSPAIYWMDGIAGKGKEKIATTGFILMTSFFF